MDDHIPPVELPEFATLATRLVENIERAREAVSMRVGYEVELSGLESVDREGHVHMRLYWRPKELVSEA